MQRLVKASTGKWLPEGKWEFKNGRMYVFFEDNLNKIILLEFERNYRYQNQPFDVNKREKKIDEMTSKELKERIAFLETTGQSTIKERMDYHIKIAVPFASLIFSILGAAVGLRHHRGSSALGLGISLIIILVYYLLIAVSTGLGLSEVLPPYIAAWIPNILVGSIGIYRLRAVAAK